MIPYHRIYSVTQDHRIYSVKLRNKFRGTRIQNEFCGTKKIRASILDAARIYQDHEYKYL